MSVMACFFWAFEAKNGLGCGCTCLVCRKPLKAVNGGQNVVAHFRRVHSEDWVGGYKEGVRRAAGISERAHLAYASYRRLKIHVFAMDTT